MGEVIAAQRVDGVVTLRQIVSAAPRADEICAALSHQLDRLGE
jgi:hypothetical protein